MKVALSICIAMAAGLLVSPGFAQDFAFRSTDFRNTETISVQEKAEQLFQEGDYRRAHFIYLNELVPIGDKYAQYMVGFMALSGLGVAEDPVVASAWFRLAAERRIPEFIAVRDDLVRRLDSADMQRSDEIYLQLRLEYSDVVVSMREVREDFERVHGASTGSRISRSNSPIVIVRAQDGTGMSAEAYKQQLQRRMQKHLDLISRRLGIEPVNAGISAEELERLEEQVMAYAARIDDF